MMKLMVVGVMALLSGSPPVPAPTDGIATSLSDYLWPIDAANAVTSTFAEYRTMHFHGGIDISPGKRLGDNVYAMRDGYIAHVRITAIGYGKMLFIRHPDGYVSTFAHLSRFAPAVEARVHKEQMRCGTYVVDFDLTPSELPVHKGELVAYTGDTGSGTEHLHLEIRDAKLEPINPQLCCSLFSQDRIPPVIHKLAITPVGDCSRVRGTQHTCLLALRPSGSHRYTIREPIIVDGAAGFAISASDMTDGSRFHRGVYAYHINIDGTPFSSTTHNRAPMHEAQLIGLYYDWDLMEARKGRFERLYSEIADILPFYSPNVRNSGVISEAAIAPGSHTFTITAQDVSGNTAEVSGSIVVTHPPDLWIERSGNDMLIHLPEPANVQSIVVQLGTGTRDWRTLATLTASPSQYTLRVPLPPKQDGIIKLQARNRWGVASSPRFLTLSTPTARGEMMLSHEILNDAVRIIVRTNAAFSTPPAVSVLEGSASKNVQMIPIDINEYTGVFHPSGTFGGTFVIRCAAEVGSEKKTSSDQFTVYPVIPGTACSYSVDGGRLQLTADPLAVFSPILLQVESDNEDGHPGYTLLPENAVLRSGLHFRMAAPAGEQGSTLFFHGHGAREILAKGAAADGCYDATVTRTLGRLWFRADHIPPSVSGLRIAKGRKTSISFRLGDNYSGVEYETVKMYIDDSVVIPEIDGEHHRVLYQSGTPFDRGSHRLVITMADKAGNASTVERRFTVR